MIEWRPVPGWPAYEVTNDGRVRSIVKRSRRWPPKELQPGRASTGYLTVVLCDAGTKQTFCVHHLVAIAFLGPRPSPLHEVAHEDGTRTNNHVSNLRWATRSENIGDAKLHGTFVCGARHPLARLTDSAVREMRSEAANGATISTLAARYGVSLRTAGDAISGKTWKHI